MTIPMWCMLAGLLLPYIWAGASVPFRFKQFGAADLAKPRVQGDQLTEGGHGAWGAQFNAWEALAVFTVANMIAYMGGVDPEGNWALAAMIWVLPVPGPAITSTGPSMDSTASLWAGFSFSISLRNPSLSRSFRVFFSVKSSSKISRL